MERKRFAIIGLGLIGGSMALQLNEKGIASTIIGVDNNKEHATEALQLGLVDEVASLQDAVKNADIIIIAIPVDATVSLLPVLLDMISDEQVVFDMGSTKSLLIDAVNGHAKRKQFVATHPMWGTEFSGPRSAVRGAFENKAVVICNAADSDSTTLETVKKIYKKIGMHLLEMDAHAHDLHAAYVSHISHITSFALANTVLEKEKEEDAVFEMASGGFESTVRLAKSNAAMWVPIFKQNRENVLDVLNEHISQLRKFKSCLEKENYDYLLELIESANKIRKVLDRS